MPFRLLLFLVFVFLLFLPPLVFLLLNTQSLQQRDLSPPMCYSVEEATPMPILPVCLQTQLLAKSARVGKCAEAEYGVSIRSTLHPVLAAVGAGLRGYLCMTNNSTLSAVICVGWA